MKQEVKKKEIVDGKVKTGGRAKGRERSRRMGQKIRLDGYEIHMSMRGNL